MMLPEKIARLKHIGLESVRLAMLWEQKIEVSGTKSAEDLYLSLGHNHIERKAKVEWEGLTLSREPSDIEKLCVKSIATAQDASKASVAEILLKLRTELIDDGIKAIKKLAAADYHTLVLTAPEKIRDALREDLGRVFMKGKRLVAAELSAQGGKSTIEGFVGKAEALGLEFPDFKQSPATDGDESELDDLTDLTDSRVVNDVQSRITAAAQRFALLGLTGAALTEAIRNEIETGSISYIDRAAQGVANRVLNFGRSREAEDRSDEWGSVEYSAILDQNVCEPCAAEDGQSATNESDLTPTPNPDCAGGDWCRCFHVFILDTVA